ncbi:MAG TPA: hypothetical protein VFY92_10180 [Hyphomicrobiaceae bacterium]|nr:hypothetical protein [Hyphomicrobiaceae bacterium]
MSKHSSGAIALTGALSSASRPKSLEDQVVEQLSPADAAAGIAICKRLATEPRSIGSIGIEAFGLPDTDEGRNTAKCRFYTLKVRSSALATLYAREARADMLVDEIVEIADAPLPAGDDPIRLKAETERRRLQIDARKWAAGKLNRLLYSDDPSRTAVQVNVNTYDDGASALEEIRQRLARKRKALLQRGEIGAG